MNRYILIAIVLATGACDKKAPAPDPTPARRSGAPEAKPAPVAAIDPPAPTGPIRAVLTPTNALAPGTPGRLTLALEDAAGAQVTALDVVHDKRVHLIVVSPDLSVFSHVHPEAGPDGTLGVELTLPRPEAYVAFADFKPTGAPQAVARTVVTIPGEPAPRTPLVATELPARGSFDGFEVSLRSKAPLVAGGDAVLEVEVFDQGVPVSDLRDYLGARGHCVIIGEGATTYLHSHPLGGSGSKVQFHTTLPAAGKYKVWTELRPAGKPLLASFVVDVPAELPAAPHGHEHGGANGHTH